MKMTRICVYSFEVYWTENRINRVVFAIAKGLTRKRQWWVDRERLVYFDVPEINLVGAKIGIHAL